MTYYCEGETINRPCYVDGLPQCDPCHAVDDGRPTVHHTNTCIWYSDSGPKFGFSWRSAYAMGLAKPNYPVPVDLNTAFLSVCNQQPTWHLTEYVKRKMQDYIKD